MWSRFEIELQNPYDVNYMQQFTEHPSHYRLERSAQYTHQSYPSQLPSVHVMAIADKEDTVALPVGSAEPNVNCEHSSSYQLNDSYRNGSNGVYFNECEPSPRNQLDAVVNQAPSYDKLEILTSSIAIGSRKSYQSSWEMWTRFFWLRKISPWRHTDSIGRDEPPLDYLRWGYRLMGVAHSGLANRCYNSIYAFNRRTDGRVKSRISY